MKHEYKTEGSDNFPRRMIPGCTCGWWGEVVEGQHALAQKESKEQWERHTKEKKNEQ